MTVSGRARRLGGGAAQTSLQDDAASFYVLVGKAVKDKPHELTRRLLGAIANSSLEIEAGGYEITIKRSKNHSGVGLLWTPKTNST
jgi:hypothetical protein